MFYAPGGLAGRFNAIQKIKGCSVGWHTECESSLYVALLMINQLSSTFGLYCFVHWAGMVMVGFRFNTACPCQSVRCDRRLVPPRTNLLPSTTPIVAVLRLEAVVEGEGAGVSNPLQAVYFRVVGRRARTRLTREAEKGEGVEGTAVVVLVPESLRPAGRPGYRPTVMPLEARRP